MLKIEKEYNEKYGEVITNDTERIELLKKSLSSHQVEEYIETLNKIKSTKWLEQTFTIYLLPKGTPRPRSGKYGTFYVKGAKNNRKYFEKYLIDRHITFINTPTIFKCKTFLPTPSSMTKVEKVLAEEGYIRPISKPDWDNLAKTYCDMIQGFVIYDDAIIIRGETDKYYSLKPRIEITLKWMEEFDSKFNKRKIEKILQRKEEAK